VLGPGPSRCRNVSTPSPELLRQPCEPLKNSSVIAAAATIQIATLLNE
jgi:hypothetical protein